MPRGSPDFQGIRSFPLYGPFTLDYGIPQITTTDRTEIINIAGKGYIFSGSIYVTSTVAVNNDSLRLTIDGSTTTARTINNLITENWRERPDIPLSLLLLSAGNLAACVLVGGRLTFEETFIVEYTAQNNTLRDFKNHLWYAKVG